MRWTTVTCLPVLVLVLASQPVEAQEGRGSISGTVRDGQSGEPMPGVNVVVAGVPDAVTDSRGQYMMTNVPAGSHTVRVISIGYAIREASVTVRAGEVSVVNISLTPQVVAVEEIMVVGYGTQRRRDMTGSVSTVDLNAMRQKPVVSLDQMLQGTAAGVQVTPATSAPGGGIIVRVRGGTSVSESVSNEPLYVIDGFPVEVDYESDNMRLSGGRVASITVPTNPLTSLNPRDIESIEILKDASATAIYGARAANGVVLITTRSGHAGAPRFTFEASAGVQSVSKRYDLLSGPEYAEFANEWASSTGADPIYANPAAVGDTDWQSLIFRNAPMQSYQLSVTGGTSGENATRYAISGGYVKQDGVVIGSEFERMSLRLNLTQQIGDRFRLGTTLTGSRVKTQFASTDGSMDGADGSAVAAAIQNIPTMPVRRDDGSYTSMPEDGPIGITFRDVQNPVAVLERMRDDLGDLRLLTNTFGEYEIINGLRFRTSLGANVSNRRRDTYWPRETTRGRQTQGQAVRGRNESISLLNENTLSLNRSIGEIHSLDVVVGYTQQRQETSSTSMTNENYLTDLLDYFDIGAGNRNGGPLVSSGERLTTMQSILGRANYNLLGRYMLTVTGRYDGSSRFGPQRKWGFFPSAGVAWRVSDESFLREIGALDDLKLRVSYGEAGNAGVSPYQSHATLGPRTTSFGGTLATGYRQLSLANEELGWETTRQLDTGIDLALFGNAVTLSADYYNRRTRDLLLQVQLPLETGFRNAFMNTGEVENKGVELALGVSILRGTGFETPTWRSSFTYSHNRNKVLSLGPTDILRVRGISANFNLPGTDIRVGHPIGMFFGYKTDGIFRTAEEAANWGARLPDREFQAGEARILDLNGDEEINELDRTVIGDPNPKFNLGWSNALAWRSFELTSLLYGSFGADVLNLNLRRVDGGTPDTNQRRDRFYDRWTPENPNGKYERIGHTSGIIGNNYVDTILEDGSFVRLSNLSLSYSLPTSLVARQGFSEARLIVTGSNLFTWSKYSGFNPEVSSMGVGNVNRGVDVGAYPLSRAVSFGVSVSF